MSAQWLIDPVTVLEPHGFVGLEKACAEDLDVVNAAKASFAKYAEQMGAAEEGLLGFLLSNRHTSPFEHTFFKFHLRAPITVAREMVRHRIGIAWNEESGRYTELRDDCYVPTPERVRGQVGKPGHYRFEQIKDAPTVEAALSIMEISYAQSVTAYKSCNAHSLMRLLSLRNSPHAMLEIRLYAEAMEAMFAQIMPVTAKWFVDTNRLGPVI